MRLFFIMPAYCRSLAPGAAGLEGAKALASALSVNTSLTRLCLQLNKQIGDAGAVVLAQALRPRASSNGDSDNCSSALTNLDLSHTGLGDDGLRAIATTLSVNSKIASLAVHHDAVSQELAGSILLTMEARKTGTSDRHGRKARPNKLI